jgi:hypothetical protein
MEGYEDLVPKKNSAGDDYADLIPKEKPRTYTMFGVPPDPKAEAKGYGEALTGFASGALQNISGIGELFPGYIGETYAGATKSLQEIGPREAQIAGQIVTPLPAAKLLKGKSALKQALGLGGLVAATTATGEEDYAKRLEEKSKAGGIGAALGLGGFGLSLAAPYVIKKGKDLGKALTTGYEALTGKAAKEATNETARTTEAIRQTGEAGKAAAGTRAEELSAAEFEKRARQESSLKQAQKKFMTAAEQERQDAAMKLADLKSPDPRIKDAATLGDAMQRRISGTEATRSSRASQQASRDYGEYFEQARGFENSAPRKAMMEKLKALSESPSAGSPGRKYAAEALNNLEKSTNAVGAEIEFKKYFQEASAPQQMGFGAEEQNASRIVSNIIGDALNTHAPKRIEARKTYKEFQTPLDAYETLFGKKGVKEELKVPGKLEMMPSDYPARYFKNRDTIQVLRQQLAGDEAAVRKFANAHAGIELDGLNAKQAQSWLEKNKSWVDEVSGLNDRVKKYVQELSRSEQTAATKEVQAGKLGEKKEKVVEAGQATEQKIRDLAVSQQKQIDDMLIKLNTADPEKSAGAAKTMVDTLAIMRDINGKPIMPPGALNNLTMQMKMVDDAYGASAKAIELKRAIIIKTLGAMGLGVGLYQTSSYLAKP